MTFEQAGIGADRVEPTALEQALGRMVATRRQWRAWADHQPALAGLDHGRLRQELNVGGQDRKDALLAALAVLAKAGPHADAALGVLAHCLLPGLRRRVARRAPSLERGEAFAVAVAGLTERVHAYDPARRPRFVATYLLDTPTDRLRLAEAIERRWASYSRSIPEATNGTDTATDVAALTAGTIVGLAVDADVISPDDGWLIWATRAGGLDLRTAADCLGLSYAAAVKRRQRAERRWAAWWVPDHPAPDHQDRGRR